MAGRMIPRVLGVLAALAIPAPGWGQDPLISAPLRPSPGAAALRSATAARPPPAMAAALTIRDCSDCPEMVLIPAGSFEMGVSEAEQRRERCNDADCDDGDARPIHTVQIRQPFYLGRTHVTRGQYAAFAAATGRGVQKPSFDQSDDHPAVDVNWEDARAYIAWLGQRTGERYRLPSEAEWEYAARAGTRTARYWGDSADDQCLYANGADRSSKSEFPNRTVAQCTDGYVYTSPVGRFRPNGFGLFDMLGNAWQWTADCYRHGYIGAPLDGSAWEGDSCSHREVRGGSWNDSPGALRVGLRSGDISSDRNDNIGFRVARSLTP